MTFEEFFKKKKIDLTQLQGSEPALFAEFKNHYNQMGEKSFDHTKKYWFNSLRRRFVPPVEAKEEKVIIENQIAEQTITESLLEAGAPSVGFKPRFKAATPPKPTEDVSISEPEKTEQTAPEAPSPTIGFNPRFKASMVSKPDEKKPVEEPKTEPPAAKDKPAETPAPSVGFKPRFKASMVSKSAEEKPIEEPKAEAPVAEEKPAEETPKPVGFKPRFNAAKMKPKDPEE